jgi:hypothetical protein
MHIHEPHNRVDVTTPQGDGVIWLVTEYGHETDTMYTIILNNGQIWQFTHKDIVVKDNVTFGRVFTKKEKSLGTVSRVTKDGMEHFDIPNTMSTSTDTTYVCPSFIPDTKIRAIKCLRCGKLASEHPQPNTVSAFNL